MPGAQRFNSFRVDEILRRQTERSSSDSQRRAECFNPFRIENGLRARGDCSVFESPPRAPPGIPKGFHHLAQGCESASYPGLRPVWPHNSEGVASTVVCPARRDSTPSELMKLSNRKPSVARRTRNAGLSAPILSGLKMDCAPAVIARSLNHRAAPHLESQRDFII